MWVNGGEGVEEEDGVNGLSVKKKRRRCRREDGERCFASELVEGMVMKE